MRRKGWCRRALKRNRPGDAPGLPHVRFRARAYCAGASAGAAGLEVVAGE